MTDEDAIGEVDIDKSSIEISKKWHTSEELKSTIKSKIESGDYDVTIYANALKKLENTLNTLEDVELRLPVSVLTAYQDLARGSAITVESCMRQGLREVLKKHNKLQPLKDDNESGTETKSEKTSKGKGKNKNK